MRFGIMVDPLNACHMTEIDIAINSTTLMKSQPTTNVASYKPLNL